MSLSDKIHDLRTRQDFVAFVEELSQDLNENPQKWENNTLGRYLEAMAAWTADMEGYYHNQGQEIPHTIDWKFIAQLLFAASLYE